MAGQPNMAMLRKMQQKIEEAQSRLAETEVTGTAGGGLVTATMTGSGELVRLQIDPSAVDADDVETLQDLVVAAVRDAARVANETAQSVMGPLAGGLGIPGL
ncbi:MAG: nucleoid-associated protein EbfC [Frankiaceae bacterium]|jgi:DNA-binding YbaB/EbfC family protein|nr:nucleoid-associated protein EbfC [Frankiaceae bacterium]MDX6226068.1 nucleoid-associated protein EbfC [Frankiales bacterium]MDX6275464.1 nucleoid-associated protein EbfC [Frankiales bacterium]